MKNLFLLLFFPLTLFSQNDSLKHDYIWLTGYGSWDGSITQGGTVIDFHMSPPDVYYEYREQDFNISGTTMCDAEGNLIFSCDAAKVYNALNEVMINGYGINPDVTVVQDRIRQGMLSIPVPGNDSLFYMLHSERHFTELLDGNPGFVHKTYYTVIDMHNNEDNANLGTVLEKNIPLIEGDTLVSGRLTATRHANGRDWWVLQQQYGTNKFYRFLINPNGIIEQELLYAGLNPLYGTSGVGQSVFSPNGTKYAYFNSWDAQYPAHLDFYDFDRCGGTLSNFERIILQDSDERPQGIAISPNSRYAYLGTTLNYYQIDLEQFPLELTLIEPRELEKSGPFTAQLAPNGKIYFENRTYHPYMHVIHNPDLPAAECNLEQEGFELATYNNGTMPNHPNYRLGRLIGSPCDTVYTETSTTHEVMLLYDTKISPNPTAGLTLLETAQNLPADCRLHLYDQAGRNLLTEKLQAGSSKYRLDLGSVPKGLYFYELQYAGGIIGRGKLVIVR